MSINYDGELATITFGQYGLLTDVAPGLVPAGALILANNIDISLGFIQKAPGSRRYNDAVLPAGIVALHDWRPTFVTQRLIALCSNGSVYRDIGDHAFGGNTAILSGLTGVDNSAQFVAGGSETAGASKKLFLFTKNNQVQVLEADGTTMDAIETPAADWVTPNFPAGGFIHRGRLYAFMGQQVYASQSGDHENFTTSHLLFNVYPGEGGDIKAGYVYKGKALVFKEGGFVYALNDTAQNSDYWYFERLSGSFDVAAPNAIAEAADDLFAGNSWGSVTSLKTTQNYGDIAFGDILSAAKIEGWLRANTSLSGAPMMHSIYYPHKKQLYFTYQNTFGTTNNLILVLDLNLQGSPRFWTWDKDRPECFALRRDVSGVLRPIYGAADGYVYFMDQEDRLVGGSGYEGEFKTGHHDFRDQFGPKVAAMDKLFQLLIVEFIPQGAWNLSVDVYIDGKFSETLTFPMTTYDSGLDTFTLDTDPLGREEHQTITKELHGMGKKIALHCYNSGSNQNFQIPALHVGFQPAGNNETRSY